MTRERVALIAGRTADLGAGEAEALGAAVVPLTPEVDGAVSGDPGTVGRTPAAVA